MPQVSSAPPKSVGNIFPVTALPCFRLSPLLLAKALCLTVGESSIFTSLLIAIAVFVGVASTPLSQQGACFGKLCTAKISSAWLVEQELQQLTAGFVAAAAAYGPSTTPQQEAAKSGEPLDVPEDLSAPAYIKAPLTLSQRTAYRARIGSKWKWSEALPELQYYYEAHGFGITAVNSTLKWAGGNLEAYNPPKSMLAPSGHCIAPHFVCGVPVLALEYTCKLWCHMMHLTSSPFQARAMSAWPDCSLHMAHAATDLHTVAGAHSFFSNCTVRLELPMPNIQRCWLLVQRMLTLSCSWSQEEPETLYRS